MLIAARIFAVAFLISGLAAGAGFLLFQAYPGADAGFIILLLASVGAVIGTLAGGAIEIVRALRPPNLR